MVEKLFVTISLLWEERGRGGGQTTHFIFPFRNFNSENTTLGGVQAGSFVIFKLFLHFWKKRRKGLREQKAGKTGERRREGWPDSKTIPRLTRPSPFFWARKLRGMKHFFIFKNFCSPLPPGRWNQTLLPPCFWGVENEFSHENFFSLFFFGPYFLLASLPFVCQSVIFQKSSTPFAFPPFFFAGLPG